MAAQPIRKLQDTLLLGDTVIKSDWVKTTGGNILCPIEWVYLNWDVCCWRWKLLIRTNESHVCKTMTMLIWLIIARWYIDENHIKLMTWAINWMNWNSSWQQWWFFFFSSRISSVLGQPTAWAAYQDVRSCDNVIWCNVVALRCKFHLFLWARFHGGVYVSLGKFILTWLDLGECFIQKYRKKRKKTDCPR